MNVTLKWNGTEATRILLEPNGAKVDMPAGGTMEIAEPMARMYCRLSKQFVIVGEEPEEVEDTNEPTLEQPKVRKTTKGIPKTKPRK